MQRAMEKSVLQRAAGMSQRIAEKCAGSSTDAKLREVFSHEHMSCMRIEAVYNGRTIQYIIVPT